MEKFHSILNSYKFCITDELLEINRFLKENLSEYRYGHSLLTLEIALELSRSNNLEQGKLQNVVIAAISHDITKEMPASFHKHIFEVHNLPDRDILPPPLYHSFSAPYFLTDKFCVMSEEVLHAVKYHSTGCSDMPVVSRIVFAADFMASSSVEERDLYFLDSLREVCVKKLISTVSFIMGKKMPVQTDSINFYNSLIREFHNEKNSG